MANLHEDMVKDLVKPGREILNMLAPSEVNMIHMCLGLSGEVGELVDAIKKSVIYNQNMDMENVIEELGDIEFYMEGLRQQLSISREQVLEANILKLRKRYQNGYSDKAAQARADKNSGE